MPRPSKCRKVCRLPKYSYFTAPHATPISCSDIGKIALHLEEYETIRLIDYMGLTQEECAKHMGVSRGTAQSIYMDARKKIARFLVEGLPLQLIGGHYELCHTPACGFSHNSCIVTGTHPLKGENNMKIAVTYENGEVFQHFGHTEMFKIYTVENGKIVESHLLSSNGSGHGAIAGLLKEHQISLLICGGIGGGAKNALTECGIEIFPGAIGNADEQVAAFLEGHLSYNPNTQCTHHHVHDHDHDSCHEHKECDHSCH